MKRKIIAFAAAVAFTFGGAVVTAGPASAAPAKCPNNAMYLRITQSGVYNATAHNCTHRSMRIKIRMIGTHPFSGSTWTACKTVPPRQAVTFQGNLLYPVSLSQWSSC